LEYNLSIFKTRERRGEEEKRKKKKGEKEEKGVSEPGGARFFR